MTERKKIQWKLNNDRKKEDSVKIKQWQKEIRFGEN